MATPRPPDFGPMFRPGARYRWSGKSDSVQDVQQAGELNLATGRLVACDPFSPSTTGREVTPFTVAVEPGRYPVTLAVTHWDRTGDPRIPEPLRLVAAARITIRDQPAASWEPARPQDDPTRGRTVYGFGVDSGLGCFLDAFAVEPLVRMGGPRGPLDRAVKSIGEDAAATVTDPETGLNVVVFTCALGGGAYPTWIGRTAAGDVACFVAHLFLLHSSLGPVST